MARFITAFIAALVGSVAANLILLLVLRPVVIDLTMPLHALSIGPVGAFTVIGAIGATIVYALMRKFLAHPNMPFVIVSILILFISFVPDFMILGATTGPFAGATSSSVLTLMFMHVVAAIIIVTALVELWGARKVVVNSVAPAQEKPLPQ